MELVSKIRATELGFETLIKSMAWRDMLNEMDIWEAMANSEYQTAKSMEEVARIQGRVEAIEYLRNMPQMLLDGLIAAKDKNYPKED